MANLNEVRLIGRLTRDPEVRTFNNGGKVAQFGFAVNNKKRTPAGDWEDHAMFVEIKAFNSEKGRKLADLVEQYLAKGSQCFIAGRLDLEQWEDKNGGGKRQKHVIVLDNVQFLDRKQEEDNGDGYQQDQPQHQPKPNSGKSTYRAPANDRLPMGGDENIPF